MSKPINCGWFIYTIKSFSELSPPVFSSRKAASPWGQGQFHYVSGFPSWCFHDSTCTAGKQPHGSTWEAGRLSYMTLAKDGCNPRHRPVRALNHSDLQVQVPISAYQRHHCQAGISASSKNCQLTNRLVSFSREYWYPPWTSIYWGWRLCAWLLLGSEVSQAWEKPGHARVCPGWHTLSLCQ